MLAYYKRFTIITNPPSYQGYTASITEPDCGDSYNTQIPRPTEEEAIRDGRHLVDKILFSKTFEEKEEDWTENDSPYQVNWDAYF